MSDARKISINTSTFPLSGGVNHRGGRGGDKGHRASLVLALVRAWGSGENPVCNEAGLWEQGPQEALGLCPHAGCLHRLSLALREALRGQLVPAEDQDAEDVCKPLSCGWEITDTLCVGPVFTPASIM